MRNALRKRWVRAVAVVALLVAIALVGSAIYLAGEAGRLPWQEEPTRIAITPFADIPGFTAPTAIPTATAAP